MPPQYGSEIERIATQSAAASYRNADITSRLVQQFMNARANSIPSIGMPSSAGLGRNSAGPVGLGKLGQGPGRHGKIRPNAPIVTIKDFQGHTVQVNKSVADDFSRFLRALKKTGYKIHSIGGYADRNIAGTSTRSLHSYGLAIDINPGANPVTYGSRTTNLPKGIGRLARRYGIAWGGNWNGSKKDTMHFSFPHFGTK